MVITLDAPIKINLALHILGQDESQYHRLQTLVVFARKGDRITVAANPKDEVMIGGDYGGNLPADNDNLIVKARDILRAEVGLATFSVSLTLIKNLPIASGLGGGSADAAAVLLALSRLWGHGSDRLYDVARHLGADVPMCLHALQNPQALLATDTGDVIETLPAFPALDMVIVNPNKPLSTAAVFTALTLKNNPPFILLPQQPSSHTALIQTLKTLRNDLYPPACSLMPEIGQIMQKLEQSGALLVRMSGSGASCFGIYASEQEAEHAAIILKQQNPDYFIQTVRTIGKE